MSTFQSRWEVLQPSERRLVVIVAIVVLVMVNFLFIWPHFKDWKQIQDQMSGAQTKLGRYTNEVARIPDYQKRLNALEKQGSAVLPAAQSVDFLRTVQNLARSNKVEITQQGQPTPVKEPGVTNSFFEKLSLQLRMTSGEAELVDFLYELGTGGSMIRVGDLSLSPGVNGSSLAGSLTLIASYQKTNLVATAKPATNATASSAIKGSATNAASRPGGTNATAKAATNLTSKAATNKENLFPKPRVNIPTNAITKPSTNSPAKGSPTPAK
ncbi:MAG: type II secretion system protein M [Verrucomicrobia bacterium]|nr:type II secretion system protein M [Verrucomicrobiota bacterium]